MRDIFDSATGFLLTWCNFVAYFVSPVLNLVLSVWVFRRAKAESSLAAISPAIWAAATLVAGPTIPILFIILTKLDLSDLKKRQE